MTQDRAGPSRPPPPPPPPHQYDVRKSATHTMLYPRAGGERQGRPLAVTGQPLAVALSVSLALLAVRVIALALVPLPLLLFFQVPPTLTMCCSS